MFKSQQEEKEWVAKAIAFYKRVGKAIALAEFTNPKGHYQCCCNGHFLSVILSLFDRSLPLTCRCNFE
jgi:hypothetical protein